MKPEEFHIESHNVMSHIESGWEVLTKCDRGWVVV